MSQWPGKSDTVFFYVLLYVFLLFNLQSFYESSNWYVTKIQKSALLVDLISVSPAPTCLHPSQPKLSIDANLKGDDSPVVTVEEIDEEEVPLVGSSDPQ